MPSTQVSNRKHSKFSPASDLRLINVELEGLDKLADNHASHTLVAEEMEQFYFITLGLEGGASYKISRKHGFVFLPSTVELLKTKWREYEIEARLELAQALKEGQIDEDDYKNELEDLTDGDWETRTWEFYSEKLIVRNSNKIIGSMWSIMNDLSLTSIILTLNDEPALAVSRGKPFAKRQNSWDEKVQIYDAVVEGSLAGVVKIPGRTELLKKYFNVI